jgi:hypothetical protein
MGLTEYFIIIVEQDEGGFRAVTVRPRGATYPTLEEAKGPVRRSTASAGT